MKTQRANASPAQAYGLDLRLKNENLIGEHMTQPSRTAVDGCVAEWNTLSERRWANQFKRYTVATRSQHSYTARAI